MALVTAVFTDAFTATTININPDSVNIDALQAVPASQLPAGVANATRIWVRSTTHTVVGTLAATIATLLAAVAGGGGAPSNAIYVDPLGVDATGVRGNPGMPFLTVAGAMGVAQSGDEILISPGSYSGSFSVAAVANLIIRGSGAFAGDTVLTTAAGDVATLNAANRSILFDNLQITATVGAGRAIVGTGATAARAWLNSTQGLVLQNCVLNSTGGNSLDLTYANSVLLENVVIVAGGMNFTVCSSVNLLSTIASASTLFTSWDETDVLRPTVGQGTTLVTAGTIVGATTIGSPTVTGGCPKLECSQGSAIGALTGLGSTALGDNAAAHLSIIVRGSVGAIDFQSAAAKQLPDTNFACVLDFQGAILTGSGASAMLFKVGGAAVNAQTVHAEGLLSKTASTFTADVKVSLILKGAGLFTPTYATPGATGDILPPYLSGAVNIAAGGALVKTWANLGHASLVRVSSTNYSPVVNANVQASDVVVPIAGIVATGFTITSTAQGGNTAVPWIAMFNV